MRTIIAGSRSLDNLENFIYEILDKHKDIISGVLCGMCHGPDMIGRSWAIKNNIPVYEYPAKWHTADKKKIDYEAGKKRNTIMSNNSELVIAFWDGNSGGTQDMITKMSDKSQVVYRWDKDERRYNLILDNIKDQF